MLGVVRAARIRATVENRLDGEGRLQIVSSEHRQQSMTLEAALNRMEALIRTALAPQKTRRKTKPSRGSQQRRLDTKKQRGQVKKLRRDRDFTD